MEPYADSLEHLMDELSRLDSLVRRALLLARSHRPATPEELRGLVISENEIDAILKDKQFLNERWDKEAAAREELQPLDRRLAALREQIDTRLEKSRQANRVLSLPTLRNKFRLSAPETDLLLVALAPELETHYEMLYAYLQDDVTRKHPSVDLALNLICRTSRDKMRSRRILAPAATLVRYRLLELTDEAQDRQPTLLRKFIKLDDTVTKFLLDQYPAGTAPGMPALPEPGVELQEVDTATQRRLTTLATAVQQAGPKAVIRLVGTAEAALQSAAEALASALKRRILFAEWSQLKGDEARVTELVRDVVLANAVLAVSAWETRAQEGASQQTGLAEDFFWRGLQGFAFPLLLLGPAAVFPYVPPNLQVWRLEVAPADFTLRQRTWTAQLGEQAAKEDAGRLAEAFQFGGRQIRQTAALAEHLAKVRDPAAPRPLLQDFLDAGRALSTPQLGRLATRVQPRYTWSDIVLPEDKVVQLRYIGARMKHRYFVHHEWGFGEKLSRGKGLTVLFSGPPGTGKTMAAEVLAGELALELYQIDLSSVVSKYIGDTERNLSAIFREAELTQTLLFFDEADALFGKRTEVKDAHDRYANIEINYLLQRIEQYEGVVVLATNMQRNLDEAFLRRIHEVVEFPFPDEALRQRIWRGHFPEKAKRDPDIDFPFLARHFKVPGGSIMNIVLHAAFLAAQEAAAIGMVHVIRATKAELQKQGKLYGKAEFGPYYELTQQQA